MTFEVLSADKDAERWRALVNALPLALRDIHFLPEYGLIYGETYGFRPLLAVFQDDDGFVIQPFVQRPLGELPFLAGGGDGMNFSDIANPYGFGGPLSNAANPAIAHNLYRAFADKFSNWCDREGVASEFASLHPFFEKHQRSLIEGVIATQHEKDVVYIDLLKNENEITKQLRKGHRSSIGAARKAKACVEKVETSESNLTIFAKIYDTTMVRRQAAERWFVPENYFPNLVRHLGSNRVSLFFTKIDDETESVCLLMHDFATAYYLFAGTKASKPELGINNFMVFETALWAQKAGHRRYFLGGGVTREPEDSLLRFKAGFSGLRAPLYTYFCVRDQAVYDDLCERKRAYERDTMKAESASDFLPLYRR